MRIYNLILYQYSTTIYVEWIVCFKKKICKSMKIFVLGYWNCDILIIIIHLLGILLLQPGVEPILPGMEMKSLHHWTAREVPRLWLP